MFDNNKDFRDVNLNGYKTPDEASVKASEPIVKKDRKNRRAVKFTAIALAFILIGGTSGFVGSYISNSVYDNKNISDTLKDNDTSGSEENTGSPSATLSVINNTETDTPSIESMLNTDNTSGQALLTQDAIKKATSSVVSISSKFSNGEGGGTGIIMTEDGYIFTNAHLVENEVYTMNNESGDSFFDRFFGGTYKSEVENAQKITVTLPDDDKTEYEAEIIGTDAATDLAIIKIKAKNLIPAEIGNSENLIMGQKAITLGYPLGMGLSASQGIISGLNKEMTFELPGGGSSDMTLIQTDAAINPGNSGGPLLNEHGQVIGITSAKIVSSSIEGIGFAIPITEAMPLLQELLETGSVVKSTPTIGITGSVINPSTQRYYNLPVDKGVIVVTVTPGSSADDAGIVEGDVIVAADGEEIVDMDEINELKNKHKIGEKMTLTLARADGNVDIEITLK